MRVWDVALAPAWKVPGRVAEWAVAGTRIDEQGGVSEVAWEELQGIRALVGSTGGEGYYVRAARGFLTDPE